MPGAVGGDIEPKTNYHNVTEDGRHLPNKELYTRWLQLSTFLPVIRFTHLPSKYGKDVIELAKKLTSVRQNVV